MQILLNAARKLPDQGLGVFEGEVKKFACGQKLPKWGGMKEVRSEN